MASAFAEENVSAAATLTRGPYLQSGTPNAVTVRWRTGTNEGSFVRFGTNFAAWSRTNGLGTPVTEHIVALTNLLPDTKYFYQIGSGSNWFATTTNQFVITAPPVGTKKPVRIWALGDPGTANANQAASRDSYFDYTGERPTDVWLMLGDNAYGSGTDAEYQAAVFDFYPTMLRNTVLWPTIGNHDAITSLASPYVAMFTLPQNGEAGGVPSGSERYYSFDYANIHFICLDSVTSDRTSGGPMAEWLESDLANTTQDWLIAFWHYPPYTKGSHNSDAESGLIEMRQHVLPILESHGVDLVLCGHSHSYERSVLLDGHYGLSSTLTTSMKKDAGDGRESGDGAYRKPWGINPNQGAVYTVAGSSGQISGGSLDHPVMEISLNMIGSLVIDLFSNRVDLMFLLTDGTAGDNFTMIKEAAPTNAPVAPTGLVAVAISSSQINLSWRDQATNEQGFQLERSTNGLDFAQFATVTANVTNRADSGLISEQTYHYRVRAYNSAGVSAYSEIAQATTFVAPPLPDTNAPAAVTNLIVTSIGSNQVTLAWSAPGDDSSVGIATLFDLRYRTNLINTSNWTTATQALGEPLPAPAGTVQSFTVTGLTAGRLYYFALRTSDEATNVSPLSNVTNATTALVNAVDTNAPGAVTNLFVSGVTSNSVTLSWFAPGDDGYAGTATAYDVRYRTNLITAGNWATSTQALGEPSPAPAGATESFTVTGLVANRLYYFAVRTSDERTNVSALSNIPGGIPVSGVPTDTNAPAAVTNLAVTALTTNSATLTWNAPGDDGTNGTAAGYDVRYSPSPITAGNFAAAPSATGEPPPGASGAAQSFTLGGLQPGQIYYFALRSSDERTNVSPISNVPFGATLHSSGGGSTFAFLIPSNSVWKYLDTGTNLGTAWRAIAFNDTAWASGPAQLGYANGAATTVSYGANPNAVYITTYFRRHFTVGDPSLFGSLQFSVLRDDGVVVYLNGAEVLRDVMPTNAIDYLTLASANVTGADENTFFSQPPIDPALLAPGDNVVAAEVHQRAANSGDLGFNLELKGFLTPPLAGIHLAGDSVALHWASYPGNQYRVQFATNLPPSGWVDLGTNITAAGFSSSITNVTGASQRFYRVVLVN